MTSRTISFYESSVGKKVAMAVSGLLLVGWLVIHMAAHLVAFAGREPYNAYAAFLSDRPALLWGQRLVVLAAVSVHVHAAFALWSTNSVARPTGYYKRKDLATNYAALTMRYGGVTLLLFIVYHVLHLTVGMTAHLGYEFVRGDVYNNLVLGFQRPLVAAFYILAQGALGMHLYHGVWSLTQTLGADHPVYDGLRRRVSLAITLAVVVGFVTVPLAVLAGVIEPSS